MIQIQKPVAAILNDINISILYIKNRVKPDCHLPFPVNAPLFLKEGSEKLGNQGQHAHLFLCPHPHAGTFIKSHESPEHFFFPDRALQGGTDTLPLEHGT